MNFNPGQRVVCVDADGAPQLKVKAIYTVSLAVGPRALHWRGNTICSYAVFLHEAEPHAIFAGFAAERFRPVQERPTDISIFQTMLKIKKLKLNA